jgi:hypothetical protein
VCQNSSLKNIVDISVTYIGWLDCSEPHRGKL